MKPRTPKPPTPRPPTSDSPVGSSAAQASPEMNRALNVTDALSYLDAVKVQFNEKPEVYNRFLDIMKDFKSQVIDTPGVIQRVSRLFHGNAPLIQGFNTFLPLGYRIDVSADPLDDMITVTTPSGTTTQSTTATTTTTLPRLARDGPGPPSHTNTPAFPGPPPILPAFGPDSLSRSHTPHTVLLHGQQPPFDPPFDPSFQNPQTTAAASVLGNLNNNRNPVERQPPGEFNHAIHYLNKIKARYADDANTYKQFLDILQTYQKEQRHLHDSQVYVQVQHLFKDAPDLLIEFKDFLPDAASTGAGQSGLPILPQPPGVAEPSSVPWGQPEPSNSSPAEKSTKKAAQPLKRKKRIPEKEATPVPPVKAAPSRAKKVKHNHKRDSGSPSFSQVEQPISPQPLQMHIHSTNSAPPPAPFQHPHSLQPQGSSYGIAQLGSTSADKLLFFDRAKKALESREMYEDFLKLLSLFSKEIIDIKTLIERTHVFLGDGDLLAEFKELIGWDERRDNPENGPPGSIRTGPPEALSALPADDGEGPSYRKLPDSEIRLACSGRDELCRSVLNDEWVSHPTWASEEAGFVAHKKNSFEEALHKSEEERFEYQVHIEGLVRTIALLEPLYVRLEDMADEERALLKLKPDLGGPSKSIYHRIIKKVYGRDGGLEVLQALQECPSVAIPVVLSRLKQKDEEWRRAQREWSRTWREVDSKNFYKSLDHQGISFKANDKKNITAKHFVADIELIKSEQAEALEQAGKPSFTQGSVQQHQLEYAFHDTSVLLDSLKMVYSFLDRSQAQYSSRERRSVETFLREFIPLLCMYPAAEFNAACGPLEGAHEDDVGLDLNGIFEDPRSGRWSAGSAHSIHSGGIAPNDLRRKLLRAAQERMNVKGSHSYPVSRDVSPSADHRSTIVSRVEDVIDTPKDIWIRETGADAYVESPFTDKARPFFANTTFYTLLRLLQLLYSRLLMCKQIGLQHAAQKHATLLANHVAVELGLDEPNGPAAVLAQTMEVLGDRGACDDTNVVYMYLLNACEKLFDNDLDQATFEEHMRWFFGNKAYQLFTLDKLITALVQTILADNRCQELWRLLQSAQNSEIITKQDIIRYRREAEQHVGPDDHLYRVQWVCDLKCIHVYLVGMDDPSMDTDGSVVGRWRGYVDTYVLSYPTEWMPAPKKGRSAVFLRR
ncbi:hypothetical protein L208DRAFT_1302590 [Tricholoma matsutake]|nr:hypothetical protein L208DRAFT_1302590 [Tricholoma matsutake 945]